MSLQRVGFNITYKCTLKCKLCGAGVPYIKGTIPHYTLEEFIKDVDVYFRVVDYVDVFNITGGEPFIHSQLQNMIKYLQKYRENIGRLEIYTNGTISISDEIAEILRETRCKVVVDDYGNNLSTKVPHILSTLEKNKVMHEHRIYCTDKGDGVHCGGWVNIIDIAENQAGKEESKDFFRRCINANKVRCNNIIDGKMYICSFHYYCVNQGVISDDAKYYVDLRNFDSIDQLKDKFEKISKLDCLPSCSFCNGFFHDSKRYVPAEQL